MSTPTNSAAVESLEPRLVWDFFAQMSSVPRPSKREDQIRQHFKDVARKHNLPIRQDQAGSLLIEVPATPGHESAPITVLQGHMDMVCEKNVGTEHDFDKDPIKLIVETDPEERLRIVRADGTTLGADNGVGIALALAAAVDPEVVHGPLELLLTTDEEAGMTGAKAMEPGFFKGRRLVNLDSEEDDAIYIGCAGGCDTTLTWRFDAGKPADGAEVCQITVSGLCGGHSGGDIHKNRGNANKLIARTLIASRSDRLQLASMVGGSLRNAIPREATAVIAGPAGTRAALEQAAAKVQAEAAKESAEDDPAIRVEPATAADASSVISAKDTERFVTALAALPHGVLGMHAAIEGLVETSNNVATATTKLSKTGDSLTVVVGALSRSSSATQIHVTLRQISAVGKLAGADVVTANPYPGWSPNMDSKMLAVCRKVYEQLFDGSPHITAIHAGLECGIIGDRVGDLDAVSFGPRITGAHSPDERVYVDSVEKIWKYLRAVLAELARS